MAFRWIVILCRGWYHWGLNAQFTLGPILLGLFTLSGFAGLIYQSDLVALPCLVLGHAAYAQTLVLAIFMGGNGNRCLACQPVQRALAILDPCLLRCWNWQSDWLAWCFIQCSWLTWYIPRELCCRCCLRLHWPMLSMSSIAL